MTIELNPNGVACNLSCGYCYQNPMRESGNISQGYDLGQMIEGLKAEGGAFALFGGEALLMPLDDLETIFAFGLATYGSNGVQTNGTLITEAHLDLFAKYQVHVGLSIDGPDELNDSRWNGSLAATREATARSQAALEALCARNQPPSVIVTLYRGNAVGARLDTLLCWLTMIEGLGVRHVRLHLLEVETDAVRDAMALTIDENLTALRRLYAFQRDTALQFDLFGEMARLLLGDDGNSTCIWNACDPYTTAAVRGVDGHGTSSNCGRTNKDGVNWQKASTVGHERQLALYVTPQSDLGCQGCRFFFACKGQCPGTAEHGDWRNRSEHCAIWMGMFEQIEGDLRALGTTPISRAAWLPQLEQILLDEWAAGRNLSIRDAVRQVSFGRHMTPGPDQPGGHGDHWDCPDGTEHSDGAIDLHGDQGRTQMHGDSDRRLPPRQPDRSVS